MGIQDWIKLCRRAKITRGKNNSACLQYTNSSTHKGNTMDLQSKNLETAFPQLPSDPDMVFLYLVLQIHLSHPIPSERKKY